MWDVMGVQPAERATFIAALAKDVAAVYTSRIDMEKVRQRGLESNIASLLSMIANIKIAMGMAEDTVSPSAYLSPFSSLHSIV